MRVRFSDSEQWSSPVKPPRSQNYVKPHDARTRVHVGKSENHWRLESEDAGCMVGLQAAELPSARRNGNYRHGYFTAEAKEQRLQLRLLIRGAPA
jgi:hypothetical protein